MERATALKKIRKLLGNNAAWEINDKAPTAEERQSASLRRPLLAQAKANAEKAMTARKEEVLAADAEYQRFLNQWRVAKKRHQEVCHALYSYRFSVGTIGKDLGYLPGVFSVRAQGDTWEEVIEKLEKDH